MTDETTGADDVNETEDDSTLDESTEDQADAVDYTGTKHKINVDGEEHEVLYEDMLKSSQLDKASYKRMEEASKLTKQVQPLLEIIKAAQAGDTSVLRQLGLSKEALRKFSEDELIEALEEEEMSPEEKRALSAERERDLLMAQNKQSQDREFQAYQKHLEAEAANRIQSELQDAFEQAGIPLKGNQRLVSRVCEDRLRHSDLGKNTTMAQSLQRSIQSLDDEYAEHAKRGYEKDPDSFLGRLPDGISDGIRKRSLKEVGSQLPIGGNDQFNNKPRKSARPDDDFRSYMRSEMKRRG